MLIALMVLAIGACSDDGSSGADGENGDEAAEEVDEFADGPAPARWDDDVAYRVDEIALDGDQLALRITVATKDETTLRDEDVRLLTNTGIDLPRADEQERTIPAGSVASLTIESDAIAEPVRSLEIELFGLETTVDVPEDGRRIRWAPAPERQMGFTDGLMRDRSPVDVVPYTFRTEGLISELTFMAITQGSSNASICERGCRLEDGSGRTYPRVGSPYEFPDAPGSRVQGTLRFLGEIPPGETELRLFVDGWSGFLTVPDPDLELGFTLPRAEDSELTVSASNTRREPFDIGTVIDNEAGLQIELGEMSFYDDRIQLDITATASDDRGWDLNRGGDTHLQDPSGYSHRLARPAGGGDLEVGAGDTIGVSLVFLAPLDSSADELLVEFDIDRDVTLRHTIELPDRPTPEEPEENEG